MKKKFENISIGELFYGKLIKTDIFIKTSEYLCKNFDVKNFRSSVDGKEYIMKSYMNIEFEICEQTTINTDIGKLIYKS